MPQAGWCRECGEWIWVDEDGGCQNGHGPDCVGGVYEASPQKAMAPEVGFGVGDMPDDLYRFSWAGFTLPFFWALAYGVWPVLTWWLIAQVMSFMLAGLFPFDPKTGSPVSSLVYIVVIAEAINGILRLWVGANGHALLWRREVIRLEVLQGAAPRFGVTQFLQRQRTWALVGWPVLIGGLIGSIALNYKLWATAGLPAAGAITSLVFTGAEVWLGVWLSIKMREERPGAPATAHEQAGPPPA